MIELRPLRQFVAVAEELHFGRAAARLHMTQPPLSMAIQALERTLGALLFVRSQRSVALSPAGSALLPEARRLIAAADDLPRQAQAAAAGRSGRLRLAFVSSIAYGPLPAWLRSFRDAVPEVQLQLREATLDVQLAAFAADEIDAGFVLHAPGAAPPGLAAWPALAEPMVLALPAGHPQAARKAVDFAAVAGEPLVIFPRIIAPSVYDAVLGFYRARGATPHIAQEAIQMQTIVNLVSAGIGLAWVPAALMQLRRPGVVYRPLAGAPLRCETSLVWRDGAAPVVRRFIEHVQAGPALPRGDNPSI
jgi:DNA-binding transcriptional LysR family regulator